MFGIHLLTCWHPLLQQCQPCSKLQPMKAWRLKVQYIMPSTKVKLLLVPALRAMAVVTRVVRLRYHRHPRKKHCLATKILTCCNGTVRSLDAEHRQNLIAKKSFLPSPTATSRHHQNAAGAKKNELTIHQTLPPPFQDMIEYIDLESSNSLVGLLLISLLVVIHVTFSLAQDNQQVIRRFPMMDCRAHGG